MVKKKIGILKIQNHNSRVSKIYLYIFFKYIQQGCNAYMLIMLQKISMFSKNPKKKKTYHCFHKIMRWHNSFQHW